MEENAANIFQTQNEYFVLAGVSVSILINEKRNNYNSIIRNQRLYHTDLSIYNFYENQTRDSVQRHPKE